MHGMQPIRLSRHAQERLCDRGATEDEVAEAFRTAPGAPAGAQRFECQKDFPYGSEWNGRFYATKRVRPIFVEEPNEIVVIPVNVYYL